MTEQYRPPIDPLRLAITTASPGISYPGPDDDPVQLLADAIVRSHGAATVTLDDGPSATLHPLPNGHYRVELSRAGTQGETLGHFGTIRESYEAITARWRTEGADA